MLIAFTRGVPDRFQQSPGELTPRRTQNQIVIQICMNELSNSLSTFHFHNLQRPAERL